MRILSPSPKVLAALRRRSVPSCASIPVQPQMGCGCVAELYGLSPEEVFVGNGSDEVLAFAFRPFSIRSAHQVPDITVSIRYTPSSTRSL